MKLYLAAFGTALATTLIVTPLVRRLAQRFGIVDSPDRQRKLHAHDTPLGGGVAVLAGFLVALLVVFVFSDSQRPQFFENVRFVLGLIVSAAVIVTVGLFDDRFQLRGRQKLAAQIGAAAILMASGLWIGRVALFGSDIDLGLLALPFTLFWMLGAINALNLIDGVDGLATSVGIVLSLSVAALSALSGHPTEAFLALALAGALVGFLAFNRPPATIFLGDAGSMLIGLIVGALAIRASLKGPATVALIAPTAIWAIPIFDVAMAILRRRLTGRSIYETDRNHLHHRLLGRGVGGRGTVALIGLFCAVTATAAVISVYIRNEFLALGAVMAVLLTLIVCRVFGYQELHLLGQRVRNMARSLVPTRRGGRQQPTPTYSRMQGSREWDDLWRTLIAFAERFDVAAVQMNLTMPMIAEEFHADWNRKERPDEAELWHSDIPLKVRDVAVGRLRITGSSPDGSVCAWMGDLIAGLQPFETHLLEMIADHVGTRLDPDPNPHPDSDQESDPASVDTETANATVSGRRPPSKQPKMDVEPAVD